MHNKLSWFFVYGTLMQNMANHHLVQGDVLQCHRATIKGTLYHLPRQGYPVLVEEGEGTVHGEVLKMRRQEQVLARLDRLEGFITPGNPANLYERDEREVYLPETGESVCTYVYVCPEHHRERIKRIGVLVADGNWRKHLIIR